MEWRRPRDSKVTLNADHMTELKRAISSEQSFKCVFYWDGKVNTVVFRVQESGVNDGIDVGDKIVQLSGAELSSELTCEAFSKATSMVLERRADLISGMRVSFCESADMQEVNVRSMNRNLEKHEIGVLQQRCLDPVDEWMVYFGASVWNISAAHLKKCPSLETELLMGLKDGWSRDRAFKGGPLPPSLKWECVVSQKFEYIYGVLSDHPEGAEIFSIHGDSVDYGSGMWRSKMGIRCFEEATGDFVDYGSGMRRRQSKTGILCFEEATTQTWKVVFCKGNFALVRSADFAPCFPVGTRVQLHVEVSGCVERQLVKLSQGGSVAKFDGHDFKYSEKRQTMARGSGGVVKKVECEDDELYVFVDFDHIVDDLVCRCRYEDLFIQRYEFCDISRWFPSCLRNFEIFDCETLPRDSDDAKVPREVRRKTSEIKDQLAIRGSTSLLNGVDLGILKRCGATEYLSPKGDKIDPGNIMSLDSDFWIVTINFNTMKYGKDDTRLISRLDDVDRREERIWIAVDPEDGLVTNPFAPRKTNLLGTKSDDLMIEYLFGYQTKIVGEYCELQKLEEVFLQYPSEGEAGLIFFYQYSPRGRDRFKITQVFPYCHLADAEAHRKELEQVDFKTEKDSQKGDSDMFERRVLRVYLDDRNYWKVCEAFPQADVPGGLKRRTDSNAKGLGTRAFARLNLSGKDKLKLRIKCGKWQYNDENKWWQYHDENKSNIDITISAKRGKTLIDDKYGWKKVDTLVNNLLELTIY